MDYINDFINVYKKAVTDTIDVIKKVPLLPFLVLIYSLLYMGLNYVLVITGIGNTRFWSFLSGIVYSMLLSSMFYQLNTGITEKRLYKGDIQSSFSSYMWSVYFIIFVFWIVDLFLGRIIYSNFLFSMIFSYGIFILFNATGETIYMKGISSLDSLIYAMNFFIENIHLWLPHTLVYMGIRMAISGFAPDILNIYFGSFYQLFANPLFAIALALEGLYIVFRGVLFKNIMNSSLRKRKYMGIFE